MSAPTAGRCSRTPCTSATATRACAGRATTNARRILEQYRDHVRVFNDDMQGTGAITLAAILAGISVAGSRPADQRVVIFGAGTAGVGVADQIRAVMVDDGLREEVATRRFWCVDRQGL